MGWVFKVSFYIYLFIFLSKVQRHHGWRQDMYQLNCNAAWMYETRTQQEGWRQLQSLFKRKEYPERGDICHEDC